MQELELGWATFENAGVAVTVRVAGVIPRPSISTVPGELRRAQPQHPGCELRLQGREGWSRSRARFRPGDLVVIARRAVQMMCMHPPRERLARSLRASEGPRLGSIQREGHVGQGLDTASRRPWRWRRAAPGAAAGEVSEITPDRGLVLDTRNRAVLDSGLPLDPREVVSDTTRPLTMRSFLVIPWRDLRCARGLWSHTR